MLLYYITDRSQFPGDARSRCARLLETIVQAARCGVDYVQLREKDLTAHELEELAHAVSRQLRTENKRLQTGLLINSRTDIAAACGADGVHLRSNDISPTQARRIWNKCGAGSPARLIVGVSCHTPAEVASAAAEGADFAVFGPIFEKAHSLPTGLASLRKACQEKIPVLALGGITLENAQICMQAGAAGVAGIRLFQENPIDKVVTALRYLETVAGAQTSANPTADVPGPTSASSS